MQYCSLQHRTLLSSPITSTTRCCFCFGSSFSLELFLHWSPIAYWAPTDLGSSSFSVLSFCLFILFMGLWRQEYGSGLPFPSPVDHILSDLSTMTCLIRACHYPLTFDPQGDFLHMCRVSLVPKRRGGGSRDPLILYSNRVLPLFVLAMVITLTIATTVTLKCLQEIKSGSLPCFCF